MRDIGSHRYSDNGRLRTRSARWSMNLNVASHFPKSRLFNFLTALKLLRQVARFCIRYRLSVHEEPAFTANDIESAGGTHCYPSNSEIPGSPDRNSSVGFVPPAESDTPGRDVVRNPTSIWQKPRILSFVCGRFRTSGIRSIPAVPRIAGPSARQETRNGRRWKFNLFQFIGKRVTHCAPPNRF
jgi:hypothetical protein